MEFNPVTAVLPFLILATAPRVCGTSADLLWDNGRHDDRYGFPSYRLQGVDCPQAWAADDFTVDASWRIESATAEFYVDLLGEKPFELADIAIWKQTRPGSEPGDLVLELQDLPIQWEKVGEGFGLPILSGRITGLSIILQPGSYFFSMRTVRTLGHGYFAYMCTTGNGRIQGYSGGWSWYCNPPLWKPLWWHFSNPRPARLATSDLAFTLFGERM